MQADRQLALAQGPGGDNVLLFAGGEHLILDPAGDGGLGVDRDRPRAELSGVEGQVEQALVGASGAISGVMAMYLGVFRFRKIEFFYWFYIFVGYFRAPALLILPSSG